MATAQQTYNPKEFERKFKATLDEQRRDMPTLQGKRFQQLEQARYDDAVSQQNSTVSNVSSHRFMPYGTAMSTAPANNSKADSEEGDIYERTGRKAGRFVARAQQMKDEKIRYAQQLMDDRTELMQQLKEEAIRKVKNKIKKKTAGMAMKAAKAAKAGAMVVRFLWIAFWVALGLFILFGIMMLIYTVFNEMCTGGIQGAVRATASFFGNNGLDQLCKAMNF